MRIKLGERPNDHQKIPKDAMTPQIRIALEENYRRGYQQGFFACMKTPAECVENVWSMITIWRFKDHNGRVVWPEFVEKFMVKK
jgi:hypothetical protein